MFLIVFCWIDDRVCIAQYHQSSSGLPRLLNICFVFWQVPDKVQWRLNPRYSDCRVQSVAVQYSVMLNITYAYFNYAKQVKTYWNILIWPIYNYGNIFLTLSFVTRVKLPSWTASLGCLGFFFLPHSLMQSVCCKSCCHSSLVSRWFFTTVLCSALTESWLCNNQEDVLKQLQF